MPILQIRELIDHPHTERMPYLDEHLHVWTTSPCRRGELR